MANEQFLAATPQSNPFFGLLAKGLGAGVDFANAPNPAMPGGMANPVLSALSNGLGLPEAKNLLEKLAYGEKLTKGQGQTTQLAPDVLEGILALAPAAGKVVKTAYGLAGKIPTQYPNQLNIFAGKLARNADPAAFARAESALKAGASKEEVYNNTGVFSGADGKLRFELDDSAQKFRNGNLDYTTIAPSDTRGKSISEAIKLVDNRRAQSLYGAVSHPELQKAYPQTQDINTFLVKNPSWLNSPETGSYNSGLKLLKATGSAESDIGKIVTHELQHAVQGIENFSPGGSPTTVRSQLISALSKDDPAYKAYNLARWSMDNAVSPQEAIKKAPVFLRDATPEAVKLASQFTIPQLREILEKNIGLAGKTDFQLYQALAGETEARNAAKRASFSQAARKMSYPWETQDIQNNQQFILP